MCDTSSLASKQKVSLQKIPASLSKVFENSEFAVFKVNPQRLSETVPKTL